jgi:hypothetical protein
MRLPRMTKRRWMVAVVVVGLVPRDVSPIQRTCTACADHRTPHPGVPRSTIDWIRGDEQEQKEQPGAADAQRSRSVPQFEHKRSDSPSGKLPITSIVD